MLLRHIIQQRRAASLCSGPHKHSSIISESTGRLNCMLGWLVRVQQKRRATYRFKVIGSSGNCSEIRFFVVAWREGCERRVHWIIEKKERLRNESGSGCLTGFPRECHSIQTQSRILHLRFSAEHTQLVPIFWLRQSVSHSVTLLHLYPPINDATPRPQASPTQSPDQSFE